MSDIPVPARERFWEEMTTEQRIDKLAFAVENLGRRVNELEREREAMLLHSHRTDGEVVGPIRHNGIESRWFESHLLNRQPSG